MSRIFYDHLVVLEEMEVAIKDVVITPEEKEEIWKLIDEIVHQKMLITLINNLPNKHHDEFLGKFYQCPYDESLLDYLQERTEEDVFSIIKNEIDQIQKEIIQELIGNDDKEDR